MSLSASFLDLLTPGLIILLLIVLVATQRDNPERYQAMLADAADRERAQAKRDSKRRGSSGSGQRRRRRHRSRRER